LNPQKYKEHISEHLELARRLMKHGWKAVMLVGGATSLIGDPGGKDEERALKTREEIEFNIKGIREQVSRLFSGMEYTPVDNYDWFKDIGYLEFLRDVGKNFSMTELLQRDFITARLGEGGSGISYAEFSYSLIQGYDYWYLYKNHNVIMQIGGSDQWGNMLSGVPLIRKKEAVDVHALSMPLVINKATGKKFGKSEDGAVWLDETKTSAFKFYQFWINADDEGVEDYLKIYTELDKGRLEDVMDEQRESPSGRIAQKTLAREVTALVHGTEKAEAVEHVSEVLFGGIGYDKLTSKEFEVLAGELPVVEAHESTELAELLVSAGLASSKTEARRFLADSAVYINGSQFSSAKTTVEKDDLLHGYVVLRRGKNATALVKVM
jgi:tyrosyl-tRNA synthetase